MDTKIQTSTRCLDKKAVKIYPDQEAASVYVAQRIAQMIIQRQREGKQAVLGLATGKTPIRVYAELIRLHREEGLSFANVVTFNLDEYYPIVPTHEQSYVHFMHRHLFDHVDILHSHIHIPDGTLSPEIIQEYCISYDRKIEEYGGLDLQLLGIGRTGHIGFNEPGSAPDSTTRLVDLSEITRSDAIDDFGGEDKVPRQAITMGVQSILKAREIIFLAWEKRKAEIVRKALEGEVGEKVPATYLQNLPQVEYVLDKEAASMLQRQEWSDR